MQILDKEIKMQTSTKSYRSLMLPELQLGVFGDCRLSLYHDLVTVISETKADNQFSVRNQSKTECISTMNIVLLIKVEMGERQMQPVLHCRTTSTVFIKQVLYLEHTAYYYQHLHSVKFMSSHTLTNTASHSDLALINY